MEHIVPTAEMPDMDEMIELLKSLKMNELDFVAGIIAGVQFAQKSA